MLLDVASRSHVLIPYVQLFQNGGRSNFGVAAGLAQVSVGQPHYSLYAHSSKG
jgi:hypothetical protein